MFTFANNVARVDFNITPAIQDDGGGAYSIGWARSFFGSVSPSTSTDLVFAENNVGAFSIYPNQVFVEFDGASTYTLEIELNSVTAARYVNIVAFIGGTKYTGYKGIGIRARINVAGPIFTAGSPEAITVILTE